MKTVQVLLTLAMIAALPGCGYLVMTYHEVAVWTDRHWSAEKAWRARRWMYADMPCRGSFKTGFKAGYRFANGGYDSCEPPQLRHYWRIGGLTESERQNAQAWSDGFTHGTVAAQQDHTAGLSAFDMAARQRPEGVPDVRYYAPPQTPNEMGQDGGFQYSPNMQSPPSFQDQAMPGYGYPTATGENFPYAPNAGNFPSAPNAGEVQYVPNGANFQYSPPVVPSPAPATEMGPARGIGWPAGIAPLPPPPSAPAGLPAADARFVPNSLMASEGSPGMGSLGMPPNIPPAPPAEPTLQPVPQQLPTGPPQATQAADWELPLIRD